MIKKIFSVILILSITVVKAQTLNLSDFMGAKKASYIINKNNDTIPAENIVALKSNKLAYTRPNKSSQKTIKNFRSQMSETGWVSSKITNPNGNCYDLILKSFPKSVYFSICI